jgi:hypothetical protein
MAKRILYRGVPMMEGWPEKIEAAQLQTTYPIGGKEYARVAYGNEQPPWDADKPCRDCGVFRGELHVVGCDGEECPACGGQVLTCDCDYEGDCGIWWVQPPE